MLGMISNMHVLHADKMLFNIVVRRQGCITNSCSAHWIFEYFVFTTDTERHTHSAIAADDIVYDVLISIFCLILCLFVYF